MDRPRRTFLPAFLLLGLGALCCAATWGQFGKQGIWPRAQLITAAAAALVSAIPAVNRGLSASLERLRFPSPVARRRLTVLIWIIATTYLAGTAYFHARDLFPRLHDECSYTIGARILATGRLWEPQHELADFFESFHILVRPKYASIYFPGTALMNVPGIWAGLPSWVVPVVIAGAVVALTYRITTELLDGMTGLMAALLLIAVGRFRTLSTMVLAQMPAVLLGLAVVWAWLHWRRERKARWAAAIGALAGWAAITRPVDAIAFVLPVGVAIVRDMLRRDEKLPRGMSVWAKTGSAILAGAAPFLLLQLVFDLGITGRPFKTPYVTYLEENQPGSAFGESSAARPLASTLPQKQFYQQFFMMQEISRRTPWSWSWLGWRAALTAANTLPSPLMLIVLPVALLSLFQRMRWVVGVAVPLFFGLYLLNPMYLDHYALPLAPPAVFLTVLGARTLEKMTPEGSLRRFATTLFPLAGVAIAALALPELNAAPARPDKPRDDMLAGPLLSLVEIKLTEIRPPAVVLFRYHPGGDVHQEPVYNTDVAWPDNAAIIRAHDLGEGDEELFRYYATRQPARTFYLFDRKDGSLTELGPAEIAGQRLRQLNAAAAR